MRPALLARGVACAAAALLLSSCASEEAGTHHAAAPPPHHPGTAGATKRLRVAQFDAPRRFWCLRAYPRQAQITIGWSVPAATDVTVLLDGRPLREGIRRKRPFHVLAGPPAGIGTTVVFGCHSGTRHTLVIRWSKGTSKTIERSLRIRKAASR
jgi:hypothetical protein